MKLISEKADNGEHFYNSKKAPKSQIERIKNPVSDILYIIEGEITVYKIGFQCFIKMEFYDEKQALETLENYSKEYPLADLLLYKYIKEPLCENYLITTYK